MGMDEKSAVVSELKPLEWIDAGIKRITSTILDDGKNSRWPRVKEGLRALAESSKQRGLNYNQFLAIRKDIIEALEVSNPLARMHVEEAEKRQIIKTH